MLMPKDLPLAFKHNEATAAASNATALNGLINSWPGDQIDYRFQLIAVAAVNAAGGGAAVHIG